MGYRSCVMMLVYPDVDNVDDMQPMYGQLKVLMNTTFKQVMDFWEDSHIKWHDDQCVWQFSAEDVKWYESYPDVQLFEDMRAKFNGDSDDGIPGYCVEFVRIGEDNDDVVEERTGHNSQYMLAVRRTIDCNL